MRAFTLLEMVAVIVIIAVLTAVAVPRFEGLRENAKISAELATASAVQAALDDCHGQWIVNEGNFTCGFDISRDELNSFGYPSTLGNPLERILRNAGKIGWKKVDDKYYGPASGGGVAAKSPDIAGKPDSDDYWEYNSSTGIFELIDN